MTRNAMLMHVTQQSLLGETCMKAYFTGSCKQIEIVTFLDRLTSRSTKFYRWVMLHLASLSLIISISINSFICDASDVEFDNENVVTF